MYTFRGKDNNLHEINIDYDISKIPNKIPR